MKTLAVILALTITGMTWADQCPTPETLGPCTCYMDFRNNPRIKCFPRQGTTSNEVFNVIKNLPRDIQYGQIQMGGFPDLMEIPSRLFDGIVLATGGGITIAECHNKEEAPKLYYDTFAGIKGHLMYLVLAYLRLTEVPAVIFDSVANIGTSRFCS